MTEPKGVRFRTAGGAANGVWQGVARHAPWDNAYWHSGMTLRTDVGRHTKVTRETLVQQRTGGIAWCVAPTTTTRQISRAASVV